VGRLNQLLGTLSPTEKTWCCSRCQAAAQAANNDLGDRHSGHYGQHRQQENSTPTPPRNGSTAAG
jgi:hypothetical protein